MIKRAFPPLLFLSLFLLLAGCASEQQIVQKERFFWPPLPDRPRIEWLGAYSSQLDFPTTSWRHFKESLFGADAPVGFTRPIDIRSDGAGRVYLTDPAIPALVLYDFNERRQIESRGTEAVLNALILASADAARHLAQPSVPTEKALKALITITGLHCREGSSRSCHYPAG